MFNREDFKAYADLCFKTFGDRVKYWATINEPQVWGQYGFTNPAEDANAATDPYVSSHNVILAHATAAKLYKNTYQVKQNHFLSANQTSLILTVSSILFFIQLPCINLPNFMNA